MDMGFEKVAQATGHIYHSTLKSLKMFTRWLEVEFVVFWVTKHCKGEWQYAP
jgi:hypothetical protein